MGLFRENDPMTDPGDEHHDESKLALLRAQLDEAIARREAIRFHIDALHREKADIAEAEARLRLTIVRLGGGFDARGLYPPPERPQRQDGRGSWIDRSPA
jgi:hypothetical protein